MNLRLALRTLVATHAIAVAIVATAWSGGLGTPRAGAAEPAFPPPPPLAVSPVKLFREWLAMDSARRLEALHRRPEAQREALRQRLAEYDALPAAVRENRLQATDLYWHMQQLLPRPQAERGTLLAAAPAELRPILEERLGLFDRLPPEDRQALVQHEKAIRYFAHLRPVVAPPLPDTRPSLEAAPSVPLEVQGELSRLGEIPAGERERLVETWRRFFEPNPRHGVPPLPPTMSNPERREMETALEKFRALPIAQRRVCVESFARFATMTAEERTGFLRNAARWESLPPEERATWRRLVAKLPPLPPVPESFTPPPLPPAPARRPLLTNHPAESTPP